MFDRWFCFSWRFDFEIGNEWSLQVKVIIYKLFHILIFMRIANIYQICLKFTCPKSDYLLFHRFFLWCFQVSNQKTSSGILFQHLSVLIKLNKIVEQFNFNVFKVKNGFNTSINMLPTWFRTICIRYFQLLLKSK